MDGKVIYVKRPEDVPAGEHWAIIEGTSVSIPGDERSRTNPGHGYPASTEHYITYTAYLDEAEFKAELARRLSPRKEWYAQSSVCGIHVQGIYSPVVAVHFKEVR